MKNSVTIGGNNKEVIYNFIIKYPGVHLREIFRNLDISEGTIRYHIEILLKQGLIVKSDSDGYMRYYQKDAISSLSLRSKTSNEKCSWAIA